MTVSLAQYISVVVLLRTNATYVADIADVIFSRCCQFLLVQLFTELALVLDVITALASWKGLPGRLEGAEAIDIPYHFGVLDPRHAHKRWRAVVCTRA